MIMINRVALLLILWIVLSAQLKAQTEQFMPTVEYGDLSELVGKNRVFVHSENLESRARIIKQLAKSKYPYFEVVGRIADADFLLVYGTNLVRNNTNSFTTESNGDTNVVYGDLVALKLISNSKAANSPRIIYYTRKRQIFIRTNQFSRLFQSNLNTSKSLIASLISNLLFSHPKLAWLPLSRNTEISTVRDFIKALKASAATKLDRRFALSLPRKLVSTPPRRQRFPR